MGGRGKVQVVEEKEEEEATGEEGVVEDADEGRADPMNHVYSVYKYAQAYACDTTQHT